MNLTDKQTITKQKNETKQAIKIHRSNFCYDFVKITGLLPAAFWMRAKIIRVGKTKPTKIKGGVLITSNHVSFDDPVLIHCVFWNRRLHFLATTDLYRTKLMNFFFSRMHCIPVDKDNFSMKSFHEVCHNLKNEKAVVIFPEGQVNTTGEEMLGFKSGAILMAHQCNKPIMPVYIVKAKKWYHRRTALTGDPIDVRAICGNIPSMDAIKKASDYLREKEQELKNYYLQLTNQSEEISNHENVES